VRRSVASPQDTPRQSDRERSIRPSSSPALPKGYCRGLPAIVNAEMDMLDLDRDYGHFRSHSLQSIRSEVDSVAELTSANMVRNAVMINFLRQCQLKKLWSDISLDEGVILKRSKGDFICQPEDMSSLPGGFYDQVMRLNVKVSHFSFGLTG
jgi:hypothetical protein